MKRIATSRVIQFLALMIYAISSEAGNVDSTYAKLIAKNYFFVSNSNLDYDQIEPHVVFSKSQHDTVLYYVVEFANKEGYVFISADNHAKPIIGYCPKGSFNALKLPSQLNFLLKNVENQLLYLKRTIELNRDNQLDLWKTYENKENLLLSHTSMVQPLLGDISWDQNCGFNNDCPIDYQTELCTDNHRVPVGCVAVAMGEIMKYYEFPHHGQGSKIWNNPNYGPLSADFGSTVYDWANMVTYVPPLGGGGSNHTSLLLYHLGVSVEMNYGPEDSGIPDNARVVNALKSYFFYDPSSIQLVFRNSNYTAPQWLALLELELEAHRPIYYAGTDPWGGILPLDHAWVIDGYQEIGNTTQFHCVWGHFGTPGEEGWYEIDNLIWTTQNHQYNFTSQHQAIIGIRPETSPPSFVQITNPTNAQIISGNINITVLANDLQSGIDSVQILIDNVPFFTDHAFPYSESWNTASIPNGNHLIKAIAYDYANNSAETIITVNVQNIQQLHDFTVANMQLNPTNPNENDNVTINASIVNQGTYSESSGQYVRFYVDGIMKNYALSPELNPGQSFPVTFNWTAQTGSHNLRIQAFLAGDQNPVNDFQEIPVNISVPGNLLINGSTSPQCSYTFTTTGGTGNYSLELQNIGTLQINGTVDKSGAASNWISLTGGTFFSIGGLQTQTYSFAITLPSGVAPGTYSSAIQFSYGSQSVIAAINVMVVNGSGGEIFEQTLQAGQVLIDGRNNYDLNTELNNFYLDNYPGTTDPTSRIMELNISTAELDKANYAVWTINATETTNNWTSDLLIQNLSKGAGVVIPSTIDNTYYFIDKYISGTNQLQTRITNCLINGNDARWLVTESFFSVNISKAAWAGDLSISQSLLNLWAAGYDYIRLYFTVDQVLDNGKIFLYNNNELIGNYLVTGTGQNYFTLDLSDISTNNHFAIKGNYDASPTQVKLSNIKFKVVPFVGDPNIIAIKSLSNNLINVNQNVTVNLSFFNTGTNGAYDLAYNDAPLLSGINLISGNLSEDQIDIDPNEIDEFSYVIQPIQPGLYGFGATTVTYQNPLGSNFQTTFNAISLEVNGGSLIVSANVSPVQIPLQGNVAIGATVIGSVLNNNVTDAQVWCSITKPDNSVYQFYLIYNPTEQKYLGNFSQTNLGGNYQVNVSATRQFYNQGTLNPPITFTVVDPNAYLVAEFQSNPTNGSPPLNVQFTDLSIANNMVINSWSWDFGDGISSNLQNPQHTYQNPGEYDVSLTISSGSLTNNILKQDYINVIFLPVAQAGPISGNTIVCKGAQGVTYSVTTIPNATSYIWTLPAGVTFATGAGTSSITVNFEGPVNSGTISVCGTNALGPGIESCLSFVVRELPEGLIAYYPFRNGSTKDESCHQHDGVNNGGLAGPDVTNLPDNAMRFDGTDDYIWLGGEPAFQLSQFTIAGWFRTNIATTVQKIYRWGPAGVYLAVDMGILKAVVNSQNNSFACSATSGVADNMWHFTAMSYDGAKLRLFLDGIKKDSINVTEAISYGAGGASVCRDGVLSSDFFNGSIDEIQIYNRALAAFEINSITIETAPSQPRVWLGSTGATWSNPSNWNPGGIPKSPDNIFVPGSAPNMPTVNANSLSCNDLTLAKNATLSVPIGINFIVNGSLTLSAECTPFIDSRDNRVYNTIKIGTQCWMKENLNMGTKIDGTQNQVNNGTIEKYCYNNLEANCDIYGALYQWDEMMQYGNAPESQGICPSGWHVPSDQEWSTLTTFLGGESIAGGKMKEIEFLHWQSPNTGATNSSGFTALAGGFRSQWGDFGNQSIHADFWSSTGFSGTEAWGRTLFHDYAGVSHYSSGIKIEGFAVRCLKNCAPSVPASGTHSSSTTQITWRWIGSEDATGYKWSTTNDYASSIDLGAATSYIETELICSMPYTRFIWAYNSCGYSTARTLSQSTLGTNTVGVTIEASPNPVCWETPVMFTAIPVNGGTAPHYQWKVNGNNAGPDSPEFSYVPGSGDAVACVMTSNIECPTNNPVASNVVTMTVHVTPVTPLPGTPIASQTEITWNWNPVQDATGYRWNTSNNFATALEMGTSTTLTEPGLICDTSYTRYVWAYNSCGSSVPGILSQATSACGPGPCPGTPSFIYGGQTYNTVMIGTQCWMKENLNIGTWIEGSKTQKQNDTIEKYCYDNNEDSCSVFGGLYVWGEMMNYAAPSNGNPSGRQGICPSGWHIPSDAEWTQLSDFLGGSGVAGSKMKIAGFRYWNDPNTGADNASGFTGLGGGQNVIWNWGLTTYFWSCSKPSENDAWARQLHYDSGALTTDEGGNGASQNFYVRCVRD